MNARSIFISGGSRGLGGHLVEHFLKCGHTVSTFARNETNLTRQLSTEFQSTFEFTKCDALDWEKIGGALDRLENKTGAIDILINNAAVGQDHLLVHTDPEFVRRIISTNIEAPILLTRLVLKKMLLQDHGGRILNVSSICGSKGFTGLTAYSGSKGAMDAFTRSLAQEVSGRGIMVNSIAPGFFESDMSAVLSADQLATIKRRTPTGRLTSDSNLLPVIELLLFSDTNVTGQTITIDGGATA
jgi:3-oxoacyl-[acyl-carrier protein] reductase